MGRRKGGHSRSRSGAESRVRQRGTCSCGKAIRLAVFTLGLRCFAREMYHAHSIEMPSKRKMPYSSHEKRWVCFLW